MEQADRKTYFTSRAGLVIDCAPYYKAVYEAIQKARHSVFIVGWDIDSRIELLRGDDRPDPEKSYAAIEVIRRKAEENPAMQFYLLKWEASFLYAKERERLPALTWRFKTPENVHFCIDRTAPYGASHHQKIIVIDDRIAFNGGMDIALGRWDTTEHYAINPYREDPFPIKSYSPYHDIQMLVEGEAAQALAGLARWRWRRAAGYDAVPFRAGEEDVWPGNIPVHFHNIHVDIVQTFPATPDSEAVRDIEKTLVSHIRQADRLIFIENQYLTYLPLAQELNRALREKPALRLLIFSSYNPQGPLEKETMWQGRIAFRQALEEGLDEGKVYMFYPMTLDHEKNIERDIRVHAKLMIVDDRILHVGAANLNSRSMGVDSECDLVFRAENEEHRQTIADIRHGLVAAHSGREKDDVAALLESGAGLEPLLQPDQGSHRVLRPVDDKQFADRLTGEALRRLGDYGLPFFPPELDLKMLTSETAPPWRRYGLKFFVAAFLVILFAGLYMLIEDKNLISFARDFLITRRQEAAGFSLADFALASTVFAFMAVVGFPVTVLIALTASLYGPLTGFLYALCGTALGAAAGFWVGHLAGVKLLRRLIGPRLQKIDQKIAGTGVVGIAVFRNLPVAPFGVINLAAGVSSVRFVAYMAGTLLGMLPGMAALCILGDSLGEVLGDVRKPVNILYLLLAIGLWTGLVIMTQRQVAKWQNNIEAKSR